MSQSLTRGNYERSESSSDYPRVARFVARSAFNAESGQTCSSIRELARLGRSDARLQQRCKRARKRMARRWPKTNMEPNAWGRPLEHHRRGWASLHDVPAIDWRQEFMEGRRSCDCSGGVDGKDALGISLFYIARNDEFQPGSWATLYPVARWQPAFCRFFRQTILRARQD